MPTNTRNCVPPPAVDALQFDQKGRPIRLNWTNDFQKAAAYRRRQRVPPHLDPKTDETIQEVTARRGEYVADMIQAMYSLESAHDRSDFNGRRLFDLTNSSCASTQEVEAACQYLFQQILNQCTHGWCSHREQDRLRSGTLGRYMAIDETGNCEVRVTNVIKALRTWKSICREVLYGEEKILNLANAPATTCRDKQTQANANEAKRRNKEKHDKTARVLIQSGLQGQVDGLLQASANPEAVARKSMNRRSNARVPEAVPVPGESVLEFSNASQYRPGRFVGQELQRPLNDREAHSLPLNNGQSFPSDAFLGEFLGSNEQWQLPSSNILSGLGVASAPTFNSPVGHVPQTLSNDASNFADHYPLGYEPISEEPWSQTPSAVSIDPRGHYTDPAYQHQPDSGVPGSSRPFNPTPHNGAACYDSTQSQRYLNMPEKIWEYSSAREFAPWSSPGQTQSVIYNKDPLPPYAPTGGNINMGSQSALISHPLQSTTIPTINAQPPMTVQASHIPSQAHRLQASPSVGKRKRGVLRNTFWTPPTTDSSCKRAKTDGLGNGDIGNSDVSLRAE